MMKLLKSWFGGYGEAEQNVNRKRRTSHSGTVRSYRSDDRRRKKKRVSCMKSAKYFLELLILSTNEP